MSILNITAYSLLLLPTYYTQVSQSTRLRRSLTGFPQRIPGMLIMEFVTILLRRIASFARVSWILHEIFEQIFALKI